MTLKNIYPYRSADALKAMQLQAEKDLSGLELFDRKRSAKSGQHDAFAPGLKEYRAKGGIKGIEQMFTADDEDEI